MGNRVFRVAYFGLQPNEVNVLKSVCLLSGSASRAWRHEPAANAADTDIFVVDAANEAACRQWQTADPGKTRPVLLVGARGGGTSSQRALHRPLLASRLLGALDEIARAVGRAPPRTLVAVTNAGSAAPRVGRASSHGKAPHASVLVVDDSPTVRKQIELVLRELDVDVTTAATGEEAFDELAQRDFALVLLDVVLPGADGYQVCRAIKKNPATRELPVVMLTSKSSPFDRIRGSLAGCNTYLVKPVSQSAFLTTIGKHLRPTLYGVVPDTALATR